MEQQPHFEQELTRALRRVPGVLDVATTTDFLPFGGAPTEFDITGKAHGEQYGGQFAMIDPDLFRTLQVPFVRGPESYSDGRLRKAQGHGCKPSLIEKFFRGENAIGERVGVTTLQHFPEPVNDPRFEIVGVTANFKNRGLRQPVMPEAFVPYTISGFGGFSSIMRTEGERRSGSY